MIFEHFALQVDPIIEFLQPGSTPFKDSTILVPKLADPPFWWKSLTPPPLNLDPIYQSRLMHIVYYLKMFVIEIQLLRDHISSCQQVFYYSNMKINVQKYGHKEIATKCKFSYHKSLNSYTLG